MPIFFTHAITNVWTALAFYLLILCISPCHAQEAPVEIDGKLLEIIEREDIGHEKKWIALLHYRLQDNGFWRSEADSTSFFLNKNGKTSPKDELISNLAAILSNNQAAFSCRFPARYEWLNTRFNLAKNIMPADYCSSFNSWYASFSGKHISINFASSYLENPSSMFGHTFLKIFNDSPQELLSPTINYAAKTEEKEGNFTFVRKGLFGGFPGVADELPFYRRLRIYSENEGRDIWEYELDLSASEIRQLLLHLWEIKDGVFDYYFLDENCAYRTLSLIDVVRPDLGLLDGHQGISIPIATIRTLKSKGLVTRQTLWPAFSKLVRHHEEQIGVEAAKMARSIAAGVLPPESVDHLEAERKAAILQLAYEYLSVQISHDKSDRITRKNILNTIVKRRVELNTATSLTNITESIPPENGHDSSLFSAGVFADGTQRGYTLALAGFQHTLTDRLAGYEPYADITILKAETRLSNRGSFHLQNLDWLKVQSIIPVSSLFSSSAWRLVLSTENKVFDEGHRTITSMSFSLGKAWSIGETVIAALPGLNLEAGEPFHHKVAGAGTLALLVSQQNFRCSTQLELEIEKFFLGSNQYRRSLKIKNAIPLSQNVAVVFSAKHSFHPHAENEFILGIKYHFRTPSF